MGSAAAKLHKELLAIAKPFDMESVHLRFTNGDVHLHANRVVCTTEDQDTFIVGELSSVGLREALKAATHMGDDEFGSPIFSVPFDHNL
jgi:hypothetical protein